MIKQLFKNQTLIPAIIQEQSSQKVLMLGYMNKLSLERTIKSGTTWFWSRSRQKLWNKGETSGNFQIVKEIRCDCDFDAILVIVEQKGQGTCHTGNYSCFFNLLTSKL